MRNCVLLLLIFFIQVLGNKIHAQSLHDCQKIVNIAIDAVNSQSADKLKQHLASDFVCANQTGPIAIKVMEQLITQLDEHISETSKLSEHQENGKLTLIYDFNYSKKLGHKTATFVFNSENKLTQLDLLSVEIKRVETKTNVEPSGQDYISIPVEICENLIVVTAELNGIKRNFILDSGAPTLYLNSRYFNNDSTFATISSAQSVNASISGQDVVHISSFDFSGIKVNDKDFVMSDLSHLLKDKEIYGLIGYHIIKDYDWLFDYSNKTFTLIKPSKTIDYIKQMGYKTNSTPLFMASETSHIPYVKGVINDIELSLGIDCGATKNLLDSSLWKQLANILVNTTTTDLVGASKEPQVANEGYVKTFIIGNQKFENISTVFTDMQHLQSHWTAQINGLIGAEILSKQKTILSLHSKKLIFLE